MIPSLVRATVVLFVLLLVSPQARSQVDPIDDPADVGVEADEIDAPVAPPPLDPRVLPEPVADPASDDDGLRDPADNALLPSAADAVEHDPYRAGEAGALPPFSTTVDCPPDTSERRTRAEGGFELWCADARGRRHGPFVRLHAGGALALRGTYLDGRRHGIFLAWFPSGRLEGRSTFERGLEQGAQDLFYESGRRRSTTVYRGGEKHGRHRAWHENGRLAATGEYVHDAPAPGFVFYDEDGRVKTAPAATSGAADRAGEEASLAVPGRLGAAAGSAGGATVGVVVSVPVVLSLLGSRVLAPIDPDGWLVLLVVPTLFGAAGAAFGSVLLTRFPGVAMAATGAALGFPLGAALGGALGAAVGGLLSLGALATGQAASVSPLLLIGAASGAAVGGLAGPAALAGAAGWLYAHDRKVPEE